MFERIKRHFSKKEKDELADWREVSALPKDVVSKKELDTLQKEVVGELESLQNEENAQGIAKPQTLFYFHKYIDAKFNKSDFDIDTYFAKKQNIVDQKYAEGIGDLKAEFTGYKELIDEIKEVDRRLRKKVNKLDPTSRVDEDALPTYDDSELLQKQISELPEDIEWIKLEEAK